MIASGIKTSSPHGINLGREAEFYCCFQACCSHPAPWGRTIPAPRSMLPPDFAWRKRRGSPSPIFPGGELLQDEQLQRLIKQALLQNRDLKQAVASVEELQARLGIARMDYFPKMDMTVNAPAFGRLGGFLFPGSRPLTATSVRQL